MASMDGWAEALVCPGKHKDYVYSNDNGGNRNDWSAS